MGDAVVVIVNRMFPAAADVDAGVGVHCHVLKSQPGDERRITKTAKSTIEKRKESKETKAQKRDKGRKGKL